MAAARYGRWNGSETGPGGWKAGRVPVRRVRRVRGQTVAGTLSAPLLTIGALSVALAMTVAVAVAAPAGVAGATSAHAKTIKVSTAKVPNVGTVLTTASGLTLYRFTEDAPGTSKCTGACAKIWPPMLASKGAHVSGPRGVKGLAVTNVGNGHFQVTFHKIPLYRFEGDKQKGQANGQNVAKVWFAVLKSGIPATTAAAGVPAPTSTTAPAPATTQPTMQTTPPPPPPTTPRTTPPTSPPPTTGNSGMTGGGAAF
jgi:predicted lipoprotein with Yx(FWY)xxD motif